MEHPTYSCLCEKQGSTGPGRPPSKSVPGLVDGHGIGKVNGKLQPIELDGEVRRNNGNSRNEGIFSLGTASHDGGLDDVKHEGLENEPCFFAKP